MPKLSTKKIWASDGMVDRRVSWGMKLSQHLVSRSVAHLCCTSPQYYPIPTASPTGKAYVSSVCFHNTGMLSPL